MAEWSNAAVLKTVVPRGTGGSNPSVSASKPPHCQAVFLCLYFKVNVLISNGLNVYLLPGMGADERLYEPIDIQYGTLHYMRWEYRKECKSLEDYAAFLCSNITTKNNVLIGSSMGGMVAVEMYKIQSFLGLVLLSAPSSVREFPFSLRLAGAFKLAHAIPKGIMFRMNRFANTFMGFQNSEHEELFFEMLESYGPDFLHFAVKAIPDWKQKNPPKDYLQIIGSKDRLFKTKRMKNPHVIEGSGHFMTFEQPGILTELINEYLRGLVG